MNVSIATHRTDLIDWCRSARVSTDGGDQFRSQPWMVGDEPLTAERLTKELLLADEVAVVLGYDVPLELALEVAAIVDRDHPHVSTILVAPSTPTLWRDALRSGVRDVVEPGALGADLPAALGRAYERSKRTSSLVPGAPLPPPQAPTGRIIVVMAPKGGCGKTTVASNLSAALAMLEPGRVAAVDLDAQFGDMSVALGLQPERTLTELCGASVLDATTVKLHLTPFDPGLFVLCGAAAPEEADAVHEHHVTSILKVLAREFAYVVVDTPAGIDERTLAAVEQASDLLLVSSFDVSSLRSLRKGIETLDKLGVVEPRRHLLLNRADAKVGLSVSDVEAVIGMPVGISIPSSRAVPLSMNMGTPLSKSDPASSVGREFTRLARALGAGVVPDGGARRWIRRDK